MNMTFSEKIARLFEIVGYLWLPPSIISLILPLIFSIALFFSGRPEGLFILLIVLGIFGAGAFLLRLYYRHSRGMLDEDRIIPLWAGTLCFNLLILVPSARVFFSIPETPQPSHDAYSFVLFVWGLQIFWLAAAVLLSIAAIIGEIWNQKYR